MGCALSNQFLQRKINPEQGVPIVKQQDEENCQEGERQSVLSETNDENRLQGEACDQKSSYQQPVNAWQSKDQDQKSKHIDEQHSPARTPTKQPTTLDNQNGVEYLYDNSLPNQPLFKDSFEEEADEKQAHLSEPTYSSLSCARPENEEHLQHNQLQNLQSHSDMLYTEHEKQNQQGQICDQGQPSTQDFSRLNELEKCYCDKPEPINERRVPPGSSMSTWQKSVLEKEKQLEKEIDRDPLFQRNTSNEQNEQNELEKENNSTKMLHQQSPTQESGYRWQNKELIQGNNSGIRHEKMTSSKPNTWQWTRPENKTRSSETPKKDVLTQPDTLICKNSELDEEQLSQGISQRPSSKSYTLNCSDRESEQESSFQQSKSKTENSIIPGKIFDEDIPPSGTSTRQQGEPLRNEQRPENLSEEGPSRAPKFSLFQNPDAKVQSYQDGASLEAPLTWKRIELDKTKPVTKRESPNQMAFLMQVETDESPSRIQLPGVWVPMPNPEDSFHTVPLFSDSPEFEAVMKHLKSANGKVTVEKIERIQNPELYRRYMLRKKEMSETNGRRNEMHLFHAADKGSMPAIMEHGFSRKSCSVQRKAYGRGLYFCKDAFYSIGYTGSSDVRYLYLSRVLVGQYCQGNSFMILPPPKQPSMPECLYESVVDNTANPSIFVVFYSAQCYPEYLITIK